MSATLVSIAASVTAAVSASMSGSVVDGQVIVAQLSTTSGTLLRDIALAIIGTFTLVVLAGRALSALADEHYGKLVTLVLAAIPVIGFAYLPDVTAEVLIGLYRTFV
jgi:uncharacterized SAM-binding protein YcdF (DUF218 family)